ncbi:MAG: hypothetical protein IKD23_07235, partial [Lentisphaeria bacterium]|nr:hypothetical protein [Lentisphaeria bacterium]
MNQSSWQCRNFSTKCFCEKLFLRWCIAGNLFLLQKISLRPRESGLAARASPSAVAVDFPEASLSAIP